MTGKERNLKLYLIDFWKRMKLWIIFFFVFGLVSFTNISQYLSITEHFAYIFLPRFIGGLIVLIVIYFFKYLDSDGKIK